MMKANYTVVETTDEYLLIADTGIGMSITNDAEAVVACCSQGRALEGRRLFYVDTDGQTDELKHDGNGKFLGFKFGGPE